MSTGVQFTGTLTPNQTQSWFTFNWPTSSHVIWEMMPLTPIGTAKLNWSVAVEKGAGTVCTYWITVKNETANTITFEGRYAILN
jgi:hypothetical protein